MNVAFVDENQLGHSSYLPRYAAFLGDNPSLGIRPLLIRATPVPSSYAWHTDTQIRLLRKWGLDFHNARWRLGVSGYARDAVSDLEKTETLDALVVNTQSVGLRLDAVADRLPVFVCLDATFRQLSRSQWFAPNAGTRLFLPVTGAPVMSAERKLFAKAHRLLPWSEPVARSLQDEYGIPGSRIHILPPSVPAGELPSARPQTGLPQLLFLGGDFHRKGGPILLDAFRRRLKDHCHLHIVTQSPIASEPGVTVHRNLKAYSPAWVERWREASLFVFPSTLETFGIVLVEALAFGVPAIANRVGAAEDVLDGGRSGWLLPGVTADAIADAVLEALSNPVVAAERAKLGHERFLERFELAANARRLAGWLHESAGISTPAAATIGRSLETA